MGIFSEIKCARCDKKYPGIRSRCPYCSARRIGRGKYSDDSDNAKGRMLISVLIMAALVVAAGVLLFTTDVPADANNPPPVTNPPSIPDDESNVSVTGTPVTAPPEEEPTIEPPTPTPTVEVNSVTIIYTGDGRPRTDITERVGGQVPFRVRVDPLDHDEEILWISSDRAIFEVVPTNTEGLSATVYAIGRGTATLTVIVGGVEAQCIVRIR